MYRRKKNLHMTSHKKFVDIICGCSARDMDVCAIKSKTILFIYIFFNVQQRHLWRHFTVKMKIFQHSVWNTTIGSECTRLKRWAIQKKLVCMYEMHNCLFRMLKINQLPNGYKISTKTVAKWPKPQPDNDIGCTPIHVCACVYRPLFSFSFVYTQHIHKDIHLARPTIAMLKSYNAIHNALLCDVRYTTYVFFHPLVSVLPDQNNQCKIEFTFSCCYVCWKYGDQNGMQNPLKSDIYIHTHTHWACVFELCIIIVWMPFNDGHIHTAPNIQNDR